MCHGTPCRKVECDTALRAVRQCRKAVPWQNGLALRDERAEGSSWPEPSIIVRLAPVAARFVARDGVPGHSSPHAMRCHTHASQSNATSNETAEWVSAPTLIRSTPVWAILATLCKFTPPEASSCVVTAAALRMATAERN